MDEELPDTPTERFEAVTIVSEDSIPDSLPLRPRHPYTVELGDYITSLYMDGYSLSKISQEPNMPSVGAMSRWSIEHEDFGKKLERARTMRALVHEDKMEQITEIDYIEKNDVGGLRLKFDIHNRLAEVHNPAKYGKRTIISGDQDRPIIFQVVTGVPKREPEDIPAQIIEAVAVESEEPEKEAVAVEAARSDGDPYDGAFVDG